MKRARTDLRHDKIKILAMPQKYFKDALCFQVRAMREEVALQDTEVTFRDGKLKINGFLLSTMSPVLHKMICGSFKEGVNKQLSLTQIGKEYFEKLINLVLGDDDLTVETVGELLDLNQLAVLLQMSDACSVLENSVLKRLSVETSAEIFLKSEEIDLLSLKKKSYEMVRDNFEKVSKTPGFLKLGEKTVGKLLDEDKLDGCTEEAMLEGLVRWMKGGADGLRGQPLLGKIRYGIIHDKYLSGLSLCPVYKALEDLARQALDLKKRGAKSGASTEGSSLCKKAFVARRRYPVDDSDEDLSSNSDESGLNGSDESGLNDSDESGLNDSDESGLNDSDESGLNDSDESGPDDRDPDPSDNDSGSD